MNAAARCRQSRSALPALANQMKKQKVSWIAARQSPCAVPTRIHWRRYGFVWRGPHRNARKSHSKVPSLLATPLTCASALTTKDGKSLREGIQIRLTRMLLGPCSARKTERVNHYKEDDRNGQESC